MDEHSMALKGQVIFLKSDPSHSRTDIVPKNVTLIACPWTFYERAEFLSQQLGLGYVGAYAKKLGHRIIKYIDPMIAGGNAVSTPVQTRYQSTKRFGFSDEWIVGEVPNKTDVIGVNAPFTDSRIVLYPLIRAIKKKFPNIPVVVGGVLATTLPHQVIRESDADIVVKGEGEIAFSRILNDDPLESIPGLVFKKKDGSIFENQLRSQQLKTVDQIPSPGYDFRPMQEYVKWSPRGDRADRTLSLISSRGCPFTCEFCSIPEKGQEWRPFTPERVLDEIKMSIEAWGVNHIEFEDDNFTLQEPRALAVLQYLRDLRRQGCPIGCSFPNGIMIDRMSENLAVLLKEAGADIIYLPVESGDTRILLGMDKPQAQKHLDTTLQVAKWCVDAGLQTSCFFICAYPGGRINKKWRLGKHGEIFRGLGYGETDKVSEWGMNGKYLLQQGQELFMSGEDQKSFETTLAYCKKLRGLG
ncbi:MAG: radical SAM protein, partial [Patescibacteria group bacterium]